MNNQEQLETVMGLIIHSGNAKSDAIEAIEAVKEGDFAGSTAKLESATASLLEAHHSQTSMLTNEALVKTD